MKWIYHVVPLFGFFRAIRRKYLWIFVLQFYLVTCGGGWLASITTNPLVKFYMKNIFVTVEGFAFLIVFGLPIISEKYRAILYSDKLSYPEMIPFLGVGTVLGAVFFMAGILLMLMAFWCL